jgi:hypothetical protein
VMTANGYLIAHVRASFVLMAIRMYARRKCFLRRTDAPLAGKLSMTKSVVRLSSNRTVVVREREDGVCRYVTATLS